jgi:hypothetical protein
VTSGQWQIPLMHASVELQQSESTPHPVASVAMHPQTELPVEQMPVQHAESCVQAAPSGMQIPGSQAP